MLYPISSSLFTLCYVEKYSSVDNMKKYSSVDNMKKYSSVRSTPVLII